MISGVIQGLGGSAAIMLVTLSTVDSAVIGLIFISIFCIGVIVGMLTFGALMGGVLKYTMTNVSKVHRIILVVTACLGIGLGIFIVLSSVFYGSALI